MAAVIDATVGGAASNSYCTLVEAQAYFDTRLPLSGWDDADSQTVLLIMACRIMDAMAQARKRLMPAQGSVPAYYIIGRAWTGAKASTTQKLAWPRTGMLDANGVEIASTVIPEDLKFAQAEFAGQLGVADRTLDNDVIVQGLKGLKAGSVSLNFKDNIMPQVLPDAVFNLMPYSWLTDEIYNTAEEAFFEIGSNASHVYGTRRVVGD